ncbi:MAG TPA: hypothetical protein VK826_08995 [Bacteroidia bacterium]|nr:hypothetical protein [Bacteroidia bacterium]
MANEEKKPWYKRPLVLVSIGAGFIGLSGLGFWLYKKSRSGDEASRNSKGEGFDSGSPSQAPKLPAPDYSVTMPTTFAPVSSGFPIQNGSRGEYVKNLQTALMNKYGANILPKWGADGVWGSELTKALTEMGLKTTIDNTTYTDYVTGNFAGSKTNNVPANTTANTSIVKDVIKSVLPSWITDPNIKIGYQLFDAAKAKNIATTLSLLAKLKNTNEYSAASQGFQMRPYEPPFRKYTLVTGLLDAFKTSPDSKAKLRSEFRRMGLKETVKNSDPANYDSSWALSGLGAASKNVRTTMKAIITDGFNIRVEVPARTLIGRWVSSGNGYTRFRTFDGRALYVRTNAIVLV